MDLVNPRPIGNLASVPVALTKANALDDATFAHRSEPASDSYQIAGVAVPVRRKQRCCRRGDGLIAAEYVILGAKKTPQEFGTYGNEILGREGPGRNWALALMRFFTPLRCLQRMCRGRLWEDWFD